MKREIKGYKPITRDELIKEIKSMGEDEPITYFKIQRTRILEGERMGFTVFESLPQETTSDE